MAFPENPIYKLVNDSFTKELDSIKTVGNTYIPLDPANIDYQAYLAWVAEGNTAEAAD
tara:strand:- start:45 stop:218 length:174 start_codon:yes stop_codon:yes gene_type:complete